MIFLTMADVVARTQIGVKDTVNYETGEWKYHELLLFFVRPLLVVNVFLVKVINAGGRLSLFIIPLL